MICTSEINIMTIILISGIILYLVFNNKNKSEIEFKNKMKLLDKMIEESKKSIKNKIQIKEGLHQEYASADSVYVIPKNKDYISEQSIQQPIQHPIQQSLQQSIQQPIPQPLPQPISQPLAPIIPQPLAPIIPNIVPIVSQYDPVIERDRAVVQDELYPPLGRTERPIFDQLVARMNSGVFNYPTRGSPDTFRLLGYLVNETGKKDTWKLFGRQKYPGSSMGEYYAVCIDDRKSDMKITLKDDMMPKDKIRDIYALPDEVVIKSPLFNSTPYKIIQLDNADLTSPYL
jgi:hypothetical protein